MKLSSYKIHNDCRVSKDNQISTNNRIFNIIDQEIRVQEVNVINFFDTEEFYEFFVKLIVINMVKQKSNCISMREACYNYKKFSLIKNQKILDWFYKTYYRGINKSLQNLQLDYVDVAFVHQFDADTSTDQIVRGFNQIIEDGKTFYWDTGNWNAAQIQEAINYADTHGLIRPIAEQGEYYMLQMKQFEVYLVGSTLWRIFDREIFGSNTGGQQMCQ
ncbi:unnamed protein product [Paramecium sonneborni]|uniref:NADP-dependent oxidoreductase domain-containing protein n=1 Tax=Paramecium sonneborni TaxID=65129 RepID=A0A8S1RNU8_9CILI|nr:unnamed protein product [Paramecium sonneborni]